MYALAWAALLILLLTTSASAQIVGPSLGIQRPPEPLPTLPDAPDEGEGALEVPVIPSPGPIVGGEQRIEVKKVRIEGARAIPVSDLEQLASIHVGTDFASPKTDLSADELVAQLERDIATTRSIIEPKLLRHE